jgi:hypothetical protein
MEEFLRCSPAVQQQATMFQPDTLRFEQQGKSLKQRLVDALGLDNEVDAAGQFKKARCVSSALVGEKEFSFAYLALFLLLCFPA